MESIQPGVLRCLYLCVIAILSTDLLLVHGQNVETYPRNVTAAEGQNATLLCRTNKPLLYCRFEVPGERPVLLSHLWDKNSVYKYYGEGLDKGVCGVSIPQVKAINNGRVKCFLGIEGEEFEGQIDLIVALPPQRPEIKINTEQIRSSFEIDQDFQATCVSREGRPPALLYWFLDEEPIVEGLSQPRIIDTLSGRNTTLFTVAQTLNRRLKATDDRKFLVCRSVHPADQVQEDRFQFQVRFRPQPLQEIRVYGLALDRTALINVTISSNPRPRTEWSVDGLVIPQGTQNARFESYQPVDLGNGTFNVTLSIAGLTEDDTKKTYFLKASNEFGVQDYLVHISSSPLTNENGIDIGSIIGIVVGIAILLIIIAVIVFARATGKWCFSARQDEKPVASETSDTESHADVNKSAKRKYTVNLNTFFKKRSDKTESDKPESDVEEGKLSNDEEENAAPSESTVIIEDDLTHAKKDEKNLVYAELVLKQADEADSNTKVPKDATEYAEIVYKKPDIKVDDKK